MTTYHLYFAYGSNMNETQMIARCPSAIEITTGSLLNHRLTFAGWSGGWSGGVADVRSSNKADKVRGVLWEISAEDLKALDAREGRPWQYDRRVATILDRHGRKQKAWVYYMSGRKPETRCGMGYYAQIAEAYQLHGFCLSRLTRAMLHAPVREMPAATTAPKRRRTLRAVPSADQMSLAAWDRWLEDERIA